MTVWSGTSMQASSSEEETDLSIQVIILIHQLISDCTLLHYFIKLFQQINKLKFLWNILNHSLHIQYSCHLKCIPNIHFSGTLSTKVILLAFIKKDLKLTRRFVKEVCKKTSQDCLMCNQKDISLAFKLHNYRFQTCYQVLIALTSGITVASNGSVSVQALQ